MLSDFVLSAIWWVCISCSLWFISLNTNEAKHSMFIGRLDFLCVESLFLPTFLFGLSSLFIYSRYFLYILNINHLSVMCIANLSPLRFAFHSIDDVSWWPEVLNYKEVHFINLSFVVGEFSVLFKKAFSTFRSWRCYCMLSSKDLLFCLSYWSP